MCVALKQVPLTFTGDMADPFAGDPPLESDAESDVESYAESDVESDGSEPEDYGAGDGTSPEHLTQPAHRSPS